MNKTGKLTNAENSLCQTNGISPINARLHMECNGGRTESVLFRIGQGATVDTVTDEMTKSPTKCLQYQNYLKGRADALVQAMQRTNNGERRIVEPTATAR
jgi:hypothetical protein